MVLKKKKKYRQTTLKQIMELTDVYIFGAPFYNGVRSPSLYKTRSSRRILKTPSVLFEMNG